MLRTRVSKVNQSLTGLVNEKLTNILAAKSTDHELQSEIHPEINFKRNSVNLFIGRRGSGKSFNVLREMMKLSLLPNLGNYHQFIYVTDKRNDQTFLKLMGEIHIPIKLVSYSMIERELRELIENKLAYEQICEVVRKTDREPTDECAYDILNALDLDDFSEPNIHTAIFYDDAVNVFRKKEGFCFKQLFENRQPKITYFLCIQDPFLIEPSLKQNLDTLWLFGGFNRQKFCGLYPQLSSPLDLDELWGRYQLGTRRTAYLFKYNDAGTELKII